MRVDHSGLENGNSVFGVDGEDAVHLLQLDDDSTLDGQRSSAQAGSRASGNEGNAVFVGHAYNRGDLLGIPPETRQHRERS